MNVGGKHEAALLITIQYSVLRSKGMCEVWVASERVTTILPLPCHYSSHPQPSTSSTHQLPRGLAGAAGQDPACPPITTFALSSCRVHP